MTKSPGTGTLQGLVFNDANGNGIWEAGTDLPLPGIDVMITTSTGGILTVTTDMNGAYSANVPIGLTMVDVDQSDPDFPAGAVQTAGDDPTQVTVVAGQIARTEDGYRMPRPGLAIEKLTNGQDVASPPGPSIPVGTAVT